MREKIYINGYEMWIDRKDYPALIIYDSENSKHGLPVDILGTGNNIWVSSLDLTTVEKKQLIDYIKSNQINIQ